MSEKSADAGKECEALVAYMGHTISSIGGVKSLTWRVLVATTAIAGFLISYKTTNPQGVTIKNPEVGCIVYYFLILCAGAIFIAMHSFCKLQECRMELRLIYKQLSFMKRIRADWKDVVKYDGGDYFFLCAGILGPIALFFLVYGHMSKCHSVSLPCWLNGWLNNFCNRFGISIVLAALLIVVACCMARYRKKPSWKRHILTGKHLRRKD